MPALALWVLSGLAAQAWPADTSPAAQMSQWSAAAGKPGSAGQGQVFFNAKHGGQWSCASCHGTPPTGKAIKPLAPAFNPQTFTDSARVDKWFRRNCKDVLSRECSAAEKADVMAYLISLKP